MKRVFTFLVAFILCVTVMSFQSCSDDKYTVWTDTMSYAEFQSATQKNITDGYYVRVEITESEWKAWTEDVTKGKHKWTEAEIKKWLVGCGFGQTESTKESSWLVMVDHGFIVIRDGKLIYMILK